jgi:hypothetical protein
MNSLQEPQLKFQITIYNAIGLNDNNNKPLLGFRDNNHLFNFCQKLQGTSEEDNIHGYFEINNVHLLPKECQKILCKYNIFNIIDNLELFQEVFIANNNEDEGIGFTEILLDIDNKNRLSNNSSITEYNCFCSIQ